MLGKPSIDSRPSARRPVNGLHDHHSSSSHHHSAPISLSPSLPDAPKVNGVSAKATLNDSAHADRFAFDDLQDALEAFKRGEFVVVMDDANRENEGDLICAASTVTTEKMAWFIKHTSGYICISLPSERLDELELPQMVPNNEEKMRTAYSITVDYKHGTTTGISAHDRALTAIKLADANSRADDFNRPGHLCPLKARHNGVIERRGHTEAGLDLCRLTGLPQAALLCELVNDDELGSMARRDDCWAFARRWGLKMISIEQLVQYRQQLEAEGGH